MDTSVHAYYTSTFKPPLNEILDLIEKKVNCTKISNK